MGRYADSAALVESYADRIEKEIPEFAAGARRAAAILRRCDKYS